LLLFAAVCFASPAFGQPPQHPNKVAARQLGEQGIELYKNGKYAEALERFDKAAKLVDVPTLNLYAARCLEKLGRWVDAHERYLAVTRMPAQAGELEDQALAREKAKEELAALAPRIPKLEIVVEGVDGSAVKIEIDGKPVPAAVVGTEWPVDPGEHRIVGSVATQRDEKSVKLTEGGRDKVVLRFSPEATTAPEPGPKPEPVVAPRPLGESPEKDRTSGKTQRTLGWIGIGVGSAGLVIGGITGFMAMGKKSDLDDACLDRKCGPEQHSDVDSYDRQRLFSSLGFGIGLVGMAAGITLLATAPSNEPGVSAKVGPRGFSFAGSF
jgi:hypothetical protein